MTNKKILKLLDGYEKKLKEFPKEGYLPSTKAKIIHAIEMIPKMRKFLDEGRRDKAFRWLGFLQCVFWMLSIYAIEELADHSRPTRRDLQEQYTKHSFSNLNCSECGWDVDKLTACKYEKEYKEAPETEFPIV